MEGRLFLWDFSSAKRKQTPASPIRTGPGPSAKAGTFTWEDIEYNLNELYPDNDSFLILEQKDPKDGKRYWFIQSAIALQGPNKDDYIVGIGWSGETGPVLMERCYHWKDLDTVIGIFEQAFQRKQLDLSGYENFFD